MKEEEKEEEGGGHEAASSRQKLISLPGRGLMLARQRTSFSSMRYMGREQKRILKGISLYFNPGELIGIMGPSGNVDVIIEARSFQRRTDSKLAVVARNFNFVMLVAVVNLPIKNKPMPLYTHF